MADAVHEADAPPPVPGFWRLGWLLCMQPLTLHRLFAGWGLKKDPSLRELRDRLREGDPVVRALVARLSGWLLLVMPLSTFAIAGSLALAGLPVRWGGVAFGVALGVALGAAFGVALGVAGGVAFGVAVGVALGIADGVAFGATFGAAFGVAEGVADGVTVGIAFGVAVGVAVSVAFGVADGVALGADFVVAVGVTAGVVFGVAGGLVVGVAVGVALGVAVGITFLLALVRLLLYPLEIALTTGVRLTARLCPASLRRLTTYLPYRHHDLIYFPLPFLTGFLIRLGEEDPIEGRRALAEAAASLGQKRPASRALVELQARSLERATRERRYASAAALILPFFSGRPRESSSAEPAYLAIVDSIAAAVQDLEAALSTGIYHQRSQAFTRARKKLDRTLDRLTATRNLTREERRFLPVIKGWLDRVADEEAALARQEREQPQVPLVFVAGVPLTPADESLFVGRADLVRLLDQDLATERPVPLVLLGQRRMGKSTLLNFLPSLLGTGTRVVCLNFQGLSGNPLQGRPHVWVVAEVAAALARDEIEAASAPPEALVWGAALDWLAALEEPLTTADLRLLIALDEIEELERGIEKGWSDPAFLDFLRAAGDRLRRSRFLLVTARPFSRLGPHWSDRLISAQTRRIEPLSEEEARALLTRPVAGFPNIYPPGGVERLLTATACHPYLLQLTAYLLTRRLNEASRLKATDDDLAAALDQALEENNLFQNLWDDLTATERRLMTSLALGESLMHEAGEASERLNQARRDLAREQLIRQGGEGKGGWQVSVPLFARWIREIGLAG